MISSFPTLPLHVQNSQSNEYKNRNPTLLIGVSTSVMQQPQSPKSYKYYNSNTRKFEKRMSNFASPVMKEILVKSSKWDFIYNSILYIKIKKQLFLHIGQSIKRTLFLIITYKSLRRFISDSDWISAQNRHFVVIRIGAWCRLYGMTVQ